MKVEKHGLVIGLISHRKGRNDNFQENIWVLLYQPIGNWGGIDANFFDHLLQSSLGS